METGNMIGRRQRKIKGLREAAKAKAHNLLSGRFTPTENLRRLRDIIHKTGKALPLGQHLIS
jgi:hypothetical protein